MAEAATKKQKTEGPVRKEFKMTATHKRIWLLVKEAPTAECLMEQVQSKLASEYDNEQILDALNELVARKLLDPRTRPDGKATVAYISEEVAVKLRQLSAEEYQVYQIIYRHTDKGIWSRVLAKQADGMPTAKVVKVCKKLCELQLVKQVKQPGGTKKSYMAMEFEPPTDIHARPWDDVKSGAATLSTLYTVVHGYLNNESTLSAQKIFNRISSGKVLNFAVSKADIETLLDGMVYQGRLRKEPASDDTDLEDVGGSQTEFVYGIAHPKCVSFTTIPCLSCPVYHDCHEGGPVNPQECLYMQYWLHPETYSAPAPKLVLKKDPTEK